jgi:hypothetical protein
VALGTIRCDQNHKLANAIPQMVAVAGPRRDMSLGLLYLSRNISAPFGGMFICPANREANAKPWTACGIRVALSRVGMARACHLPQIGDSLVSQLSSTWGRADQQASHDSNESGAFCFVVDFLQAVESFAPPVRTRLPSGSSRAVEVCG